MLSWVSGIHRSHKPPSWYDNETRSTVRPLTINTVDNQQETPSRRRLGLLPTLRKALEAATHASNGSFPIHEPAVPPPSPDDETVFEACDSASQCSLSRDDSCSTHLSYNMSRLDDGGFAGGIDPCDSVGPSPTASDADSFFGVEIRDMSTMALVEERDDVWLLSAEDAIRDSDGVPPVEVLQPSASLTSIFSRVQVLVLPGLPESQKKRKQEVCCKWQDDAEDEEEIEFDDGTFLINETEELSHLTEDNDGSSDENHNADIMMRLGRPRTHRLGKNIKGIWGSTEYGKRAWRGYRQTKKQTHRKPSPVKLYNADPLKELSICHERMMPNGDIFTPKRAFSRIRSRIRRDLDKPSAELLSISSSASMDGGSELTYPSGLCSSISASTSMDAGTSMETCLLDQQLGIAHSISSEESLSFARATPLTYGAMFKNTNAEPPPSYKKIMFKSPRNDTPRVVLGDEVSESGSGEGPRPLYTDEGFVEAYVHSKSSSRSLDSQYSLNHVFHSELCTLYEVSSSLESDSFGSASGSAALTADTSKGAACDSRSRGPPSRTSSSTISDSSGHHEAFENHPPLAKKIPKEACHMHGDNDQSQRGCFVDDRDVQIRWEFSLGMMDEWGNWRRQKMPLMNTEELSRDYVAEI